MLPRQGDPTFPFDVFSLSVLLPLDLMWLAKIRLELFFSKERLRGKVFPFSRSILCFGCLGCCLNGLRKGFVLSRNYLHAPDHPLYSAVPPSDHSVCGASSG